MKKILFTFAGFVLAILLIFSFLWFLIPKARNEFAGQKPSTPNASLLHYTALGDSLTQGVGDATGQGGFVPLFATEIENKFDSSVKFQNFGKAGDTSTQIYQRMTSQKKIEQGLKNADIITITVGGNDVMKVIRKHFTNLSNLSEKDFVAPAKAYQKQLRQIFLTIRKENAHAQIYVLGIYNPFYLNFPNVTAMQEVVDNWNEATDQVVKSEKKAYFVPINDLLYKGLNGKQAVEVSSSTSESSDVQNDLLYSTDHFHPNNTGYQIMANAVFSSYQKVNKK